jgi:hypothetical protein
MAHDLVAGEVVGGGDEHGTIILSVRKAAL